MTISRFYYLEIFRDLRALQLPLFRDLQSAIRLGNEQLSQEERPEQAFKRLVRMTNHLIPRLFSVADQFIQFRSHALQTRTPKSAVEEEEFMQAQGQEVHIRCQKALQDLGRFSYKLLDLAKRTSENVARVAHRALNSQDQLEPWMRTADLSKLQETVHQLYNKHCALFPTPANPLFDAAPSLKEETAPSPAAADGSQMLLLYERLLTLQDRVGGNPLPFLQPTWTERTSKIAEDFSALEADLNDLSQRSKGRALQDIVQAQLSSRDISRPLEALRTILATATEFREREKAWHTTKEVVRLVCSDLHQNPNASKTTIETVSTVIKYTKTSIRPDRRIFRDKGFLCTRVGKKQAEVLAQPWQETMDFLTAAEWYCQERLDGLLPTAHSYEETLVASKKKPPAEETPVSQVAGQQPPREPSAQGDPPKPVGAPPKTSWLEEVD